MSAYDTPRDSLIRQAKANTYRERIEAEIQKRQDGNDRTSLVASVAYVVDAINPISK